MQQDSCPASSRDAASVPEESKCMRWGSHGKNKALKTETLRQGKNAGGAFYIPENNYFTDSFPLVLCYDRGGNRLWSCLLSESGGERKNKMKYRLFVSSYTGGKPGDGIYALSSMESGSAAGMCGGWSILLYTAGRGPAVCSGGDGKRGGDGHISNGEGPGAAGAL